MQFLLNLIMKVLFGMHSMFSTNFGSGNGGDDDADDDLWGDASILDRDWNHRKSQFVKVYIDFDFHGYWL
jgi:hypothetical protein